MALAAVAPRLAGAQAGAGQPAAAGDAMASVKTVVDQATVVFKDHQLTPAEREKQLRAIAENHFDFGEMARSACGYHWRSFTPEQQGEFVPLFTAFIEDAYLSRMEEYSVEKVQQDIQSSRVQFIKESSDGPDYGQVYSTVALTGRDNPLQVNYQVRRDGSGWKIYDISIDSISVIANYRNQFNRVLNSDGYAKLVEIMRAKQRALSASMSK